LLQADLAEVGVEATPVPLEWGTLVSQITDAESRDFDGFVIQYSTEFRLDDRDLFHSDRADQAYAWAGTRNVRIDALLDTLQLVPDREVAKPLWSEYQLALLEEQPYTYLYFMDRLTGMSDRLQNVTMDERGEWATIQEWSIPTDRRKYRMAADG
jgi:ABC-type transport system substrate-binding protein